MALNSGIPAASFWRRGEIGSRTGLLIPQPFNSGYESSSLSVSASINLLRSHLTTALCSNLKNAPKGHFYFKNPDQAQYIWVAIESLQHSSVVKYNGIIQEEICTRNRSLGASWNNTINVQVEVATLG